MGKEEEVKVLNEGGQPGSLASWGGPDRGVCAVGHGVILRVGSLPLAGGRRYIPKVLGDSHFGLCFPCFLIYFRPNLGRSGLKSAQEQLMEL